LPGTTLVLLQIDKSLYVAEIQNSKRKIEKMGRKKREKKKRRQMEMRKNAEERKET